MTKQYPESPPQYYGTYEALRGTHSDTSTFTLTASLNIPSKRTGPLITPDDFWHTFASRNPTDSSVSLTIDQCDSRPCIRLWDSSIRANAQPYAAKLREKNVGKPFALFHGHVAIPTRVIYLPPPVISSFSFERAVLATPQDSIDPGETICIYQFGPLEEILKSRIALITRRKERASLQ